MRKKPLYNDKYRISLIRDIDGLLELVSDVPSLILTVEEICLMVIPLGRYQFYLYGDVPPEIKTPYLFTY